MAILRLAAVLLAHVSLHSVRAGPIELNLVPEPEEDMEVTEYSGHEGLHRLNRVNFNSTMEHSGIQHWIVFYCVSWWPKCQDQVAHYRAKALHAESKVNTGLLSKQIRFGLVDCAVDKPLCNDQGVDDYPWTVHYHKGQWTSAWVDFVKNKGFTKWLAEIILWDEIDDDEDEQTILQIVKAVVLDSLQDTKSFRCVNLLIICAAIVISMRPVLRQLFPDTTKEATAKAFQGESASDLASCIPREWGRDRASLEL